ncbi:MAG: Hsp70 family protein, partial [Myxococcaceae bacterium]|nr:Hsp70 family protein [Myxococcaceae bacterium]
MAADGKPVVLRIRLPFQSEGEFISRYGHHLAPNGIFIATRSLKSPGTAVSFELVLQDGGRLLRGEARVDSIIEDPTPGKAGMQLTFVRLDEPSLGLLRRAIPPPAPSPAPRPSAPLPRAAPPPPRPHGWGLDLSDTVVRGAAYDAQGLREGAEQLAVPALAVPSPEAPGGVRVGEAAERLFLESKAVPIEVLRQLGHAAAGLGPAPVDLGALLLAEVREQLTPHLGALSPRVVFAVPAHWTARQRNAVVEAGAGVGLTARLINASTAATLALTSGRQLARKRLLVVTTGALACEAAVVQVTGDDLEVVAVVTSAEAALQGLVERLVPKETVPLDELARRRRLLCERVPGAGPQ